MLIFIIFMKLIKLTSKKLSLKLIYDEFGKYFIKSVQFNE